VFGNFRVSFLGAWIGVLGLGSLVLNFHSYVWFSFISFGFIGVVKNIVKKMIYLGDWNTKKS
jgi:hypothetical protein